MADDKLALSYIPSELSWRDVVFEVPISKTERKAIIAQNAQSGFAEKPPTHKTILDGVSGHLAPGSFTAIMGASGSGKTTLLNYLSNRKFYLKSVKCAGKVFLNGHERADVDFNEYVAYVMQDDVLIETMTVREILEFTAKLRLGPEKAMKRMDEVVQQLELSKILDSRVGGILSRGISGGERKRVAIAMEILTDPLVLFLDEPTTGLDSYSAENVISLCNHLSQLGKTVCCTIHQPNSYIFSIFQDLLILANKQLVYSGNAKEAVKYFAEMGFPFPEFSNPAEHLIDVLSEHANAERFPGIPDDSPISKTDLPHYSSSYRASFRIELRFLIIRSFRNYVRNKLMLKFKVIGKLTFIFIFLSCFWQNAGSNDARSVADCSGFLSFFLTGTAFDAVSSIGAYHDEKAQYVREQANRTYSPISYYISKLVSEMPFEVIMTALYIAVVYSGVGLSYDTGYQVLIFILLNIILLVNGKGWCNLLLFSFQNIAASAAVMPFTMVLQLLFGGFFINYENIPKYLYEFEYISVFKYTWSAAMINEFNSFDKKECGPAPQCDAVKFYNIELSLWGNVGVALGITVVVHLVAFFVLYRLSKAFRS